MNGQCARVLEVLADRQPHSVTEIHQLAGTMRLNSRVSELRQKHGLNIVCTRSGGRGPDSYLYTLMEGGSDVQAIPGRLDVGRGLMRSAEPDAFQGASGSEDPTGSPPRGAGPGSGRVRVGPSPDELQQELDWIDGELAHGIEIPSENARRRRESLRRQRDLLEARR